MLKIRKHLIWIVLLTLLGGAGAYALSRWAITPVYTAEASMCVIAGKRDSTAVTSNDIAADNSLANTYRVLLTSQPVMEQVNEKLGGGYSVTGLSGMVQAEVASNAQILYIKVRSSDPQRSIRIAEALLEVAPQTVPALAGGGEVKAVDHALSAPKTAPSVKNNVIVGLIGGAAASFALFVVLALFDTTLWREEDIERLFPYPVLGCIPAMDGTDGKAQRKKG